jgi:DNA helicase-2/ATP-dependent DNA helicase PcrA
MTDVLSVLSDRQRQAALHRDGPLVVFAGAGSGKTRVITSRIAQLVGSGVPPWNILAVTFTNKAAAEMRDRLLSMCPEADACFVSTFHSACARWLREFGNQLGFSGDFLIYDDADASSAIKVVLQKMTSTEDAAKLLPEMKSFIHDVKTAGLFPGDVERLQGQMSVDVPDGGVRVYKAYQEYLAQCNAMDFNDLLLNMLLILRSSKVVKDVLQKRYRYVLVDEYQDTNRAQFELIGHIVEESRNLFVVGDDDQSIYSWRGATPSNIIDFERHYPDAKRVILEENYRSSANIVEAAAAMISNNINRVAKVSKTSNEAGELIELHQDADGEMEAWWVADSIRRESRTYPYDDVAIFYRTNAQSRLIEDALRHQNIPYQIFGAVKFYDRVEIKDLMAYLRLLVNPLDDVSFRRVVNIPARGIGDKAVADLQAHAAQIGQPLMNCAKALSVDSKSKIGRKFSSFVEIMGDIDQKAAKLPIADVVAYISKRIEYPEYLKKKYPDLYRDKIENVHELMSGIAQYAEKHPKAGLIDWLQAVSLVRDESDELKPGVSLMTLHMAKGLEFNRVYILGVEEGVLPHKNNAEDLALLEEERRLFYVGMTRARQRLSLSCVNRRRNYNQVVENRPSRFIDEIPARFYEARETSPAVESNGYSYDYSDDVDHREFIIGDTVVHAAFGRGTVEEIDRSGNAVRVLVNFWDFGRRKVSLMQLQSTPNGAFSI